MVLNFLDVSVEYSKSKKLKKDDVKSLLTWVSKQPHLPKITELQAILFLQSCHYRNEAAKTALDTYFTVKTFCPEIFGSRNPLVAPLKNSMNIIINTTLPKPTPDGSTIILMKIIDKTVDKYVFADHCRMFDMILMLHLYTKGTSKGHLILFDMQGLTFGHLAKLGPIIIKKVLYYLQEGLPVRLKGLHFVNIVPFMDKVLALMRPFMKKELMEMLFLHNTVDDLVKYVPRECLPEEYGGSADPIPVLHGKMKTDLKENIDLFRWEETQKIDERQRRGKPKSVNEIFGVEGTFKKLEID